jgi:hypothetical protein
VNAGAVRSRLALGLRVYRQLGPVRGTAVALRRITSVVRLRLRARLLERRPLTVTAAELRSALSGRDARSALLAAGQALPSVMRLADGLDDLARPERERILSVADRILDHRFDLLGSGVVALGSSIDWHQDFKSGRRWPLDHISRIVVVYPDGSDIKVPWELSRCQHLPVLALAYRLTGDQRYLDEVGAQLRSWIRANPVEFGVNWQCTMDVAIRAVNWVATLALCADVPEVEPWLDEVTASLLLHARFIRANLEYGPARGNHYLSDIVGLLVLASVFRDSAPGRRWTDWAVRQLGIELAHQVRSDGCVQEASTSYHRLVTELFVVGADAADVLAPGRLDATVRPRIELMLQFVADYTRPDGLAPQLGDADDGRLLPLADYGSADQRRHLHLFAQAGRPYAPARRSAAYQAGGFYILRAGELFAAVRCGDVGIHGRGCHAHNDLLGFELCWGETTLVVDPGTYLYTADPAARDRFRSTEAHSTLQVDQLEQNEIRPDRPFAMPDRARPELLHWDAGERQASLTGRHRGFATSGDACLHTRSVSLSADRCALELVDTVSSQRTHALTWRFPMPSHDVETDGGSAVVRFPDVAVELRSDGSAFSVQPGWMSPSYGVRRPISMVSLRSTSRPGAHTERITLIVSPR